MKEASLLSPPPPPLSITIQRILQTHPPSALSVSMCVHGIAPRHFSQPPGKCGGGCAETSTAVISGFFIYYAAGYYIKNCFLLPPILFTPPSSSLLFSCSLSQLLASSLCREDSVAPSCRDILIFPFGKTKEIVKNFPHVERSQERPVYVGRSSAFPEGSKQPASSHSYHPTYKNQPQPRN